jgi:hypothetical protein
MYINCGLPSFSWYIHGKTDLPRRRGDREEEGDVAEEGWAQA